MFAACVRGLPRALDENRLVLARPFFKTVRDSFARRQVQIMTLFGSALLSRILPCPIEAPGG